MDCVLLLLQVVSLSMVASGVMLNPSFLGLPTTVQGVPFVQSLVIIHMLVCVVVLTHSLGVVATDFRYQMQVEDEERKYHKVKSGVWQSHAATFKKWTERLASFADGGSAAADAKVAALPTSCGGPPSSQAQSLPPPASALSVGDVKVETAGAAGADAHALAPGASPSLAELQRAQVELLLALPALYHREDPTQPPRIWNPFGELRPGFLPQYNKHLQKRAVSNHRLVWLVPALYLTTWVLDLVVYFGFSNATK